MNFGGSCSKGPPEEKQPEALIQEVLPPLLAHFWGRRGDSRLLEQIFWGMPLSLPQPSDIPLEGEGLGNQQEGALTSELPSPMCCEPDKRAPLPGADSHRAGCWPSPPPEPREGRSRRARQPGAGGPAHPRRASRWIPDAPSRPKPQGPRPRLGNNSASSTSVLFFSAEKTTILEYEVCGLKKLPPAPIFRGLSRPTPVWTMPALSKTPTRAPPRTPRHAHPPLPRFPEARQDHNNSEPVPSFRRCSKRFPGINALTRGSRRCGTSDTRGGPGSALLALSRASGRPPARTSPPPGAAARPSAAPESRRPRPPPPRLQAPGSAPTRRRVYRGPSETFTPASALHGGN